MSELRRFAIPMLSAWILWADGLYPTPQGSYWTKWGCEWDARSKLNEAYTKAKSQEGTKEASAGNPSYEYNYGKVTRTADEVRQKYTAINMQSGSVRDFWIDGESVTKFVCYPESFDPRPPQRR